METLTQLLENAVATTVVHVHEQTECDGFREGLKQYFSLVKPSVTRYEHHLGNDIIDQALQKRYEYETALLHVLTGVFSYHVNQDSITWPAREPDSPYRWYQLPLELSEHIEDIVIELSKSDSPTLAISHVSGQVLDRASERYLGEFYTPLSIAEHLIELSGLQPNELLDGYRVIDPACGGGIILTAIVDEVISYAKKEKISPKSVVQNVSHNLFGFDIQPFAIFTTRSLLIYRCLPLLNEYDKSNLPLLFPNIKLQDALITHDQYWSEREGPSQYLPDDKGFHYIIGNPPFMSAKGKKLYDYLQHYEDVLYGHPNLYQLFLWWAVRAAVKGGIVSFLLPQTMLAGTYSKKLRERLDYQTNIISITRIIDRTGVVGDADQQMMAVCLQASKNPSTSEEAVNVRITRNGDGISSAKPHSIKHSRIVQRVEELSFWVVSDNILDYTICERLEAKCVPLVKMDEIFTSGNGGYVWNQNKELLLETHKDNSLPLISAASIELYGFNFPYVGPHASHKRPFSLVNQKVENVIHSQPALLIQRTTPRKVGRRLVIGMPSDEFYAKYPRYFLENHVNYIRVQDKSSS